MAIEINGKTIETMKDLDDYIKSLQNEVKTLTSTIDTLKNEIANTVKSIETTTSSFVTGLKSASAGTMYVYRLGGDGSTHRITGDEDIGGSISAKLAMIFNIDMDGYQIFVIMYTTSTYWYTGDMNTVCWVGDGRIMVDDVQIKDWTELSSHSVSKSSAITDISIIKEE